MSQDDWKMTKEQGDNQVRSEVSSGGTEGGQKQRQETHAPRALAAAPSPFLPCGSLETPPGVSYFTLVGVPKTCRPNQEWLPIILPIFFLGDL